MNSRVIKMYGAQEEVQDVHCTLTKRVVSHNCLLAIAIILTWRNSRAQIHYYLGLIGAWIYTHISIYWVIKHSYPLPQCWWTVWIYVHNYIYSWAQDSHNNLHHLLHSIVIIHYLWGIPEEWYYPVVMATSYGCGSDPLPLWKYMPFFTHRKRN